MSIEIDTVLSGIIIVLLIIVVWKWYGGKNNQSCDNNRRLSCGCLRGQCRCGGNRMNTGAGSYVGACPGGKLCVCECPLGSCNCDPMCKCNRRAESV